MKKIAGLMICLFAFTGFLSGQKINVASYNVRMDADSDRRQGDGWEKRCPKLCELVKYHDFDIFGAQEPEYHQLNDMLKELPSYAYTGVGRDDGINGGEFSPIFYKTEKLELLETGTFWLSPEPAVPGRGWDAACNRVCTWGKFRFIEGGKEFWFFNTHLDHMGRTARLEGMKLILSRIIELTAPGNHVILTGDFNSSENDEVYRLIGSVAILEDSYFKSPVKYSWVGTFNDFKPAVYEPERIDYIFVSPSLKVLRYGVLTDSYRDAVSPEDRKSGNLPVETELHESIIRLPSDHYPVAVQLEF